MRFHTLAFLLAACAIGVSGSVTEDNNASVQLEDLSEGGPVEEEQAVLEGDEQEHRNLRRTRPSEREGGRGALPTGVRVVPGPRGTNTYIMNVYVWYWLGAKDLCINPIEWCNSKIVEEFEFAKLYQDEPDRSAVYAMVEAGATCWAQAKSLTRLNAMVYGQAELTVQQIGRIGPIPEVNFRSRLHTCTLSVAFARSQSEAAAFSQGTAGAAVEPNGMCRDLPSNHRWKRHRMCTTGGGEVEATGEADAVSTSSAFSRSLAESRNSQLVSVISKGRSIDFFEAVVVGGASSFTRSKAKSITTAITDVVADADGYTWIQNCEEWLVDFCGSHRFPWCQPIKIREYCREAEAEAYTRVSAKADAFAKAVAESFGNLEVSVAMNAYLRRNELTGAIDMGLNKNSGFSAGVVATCRAKT